MLIKVISTVTYKVPPPLTSLVPFNYNKPTSDVTRKLKFICEYIGLYEFK